MTGNRYLTIGLRNKSNRYSLHLADPFEHTLQLISTNPKIGRTAQESGIRTKMVRDYLLIYKFNEDTITLLSIWDTRQDPKKLEY